MNDTMEKTIGQLVAEDYRTAQVFKAHNIDFCCKGNRTLTEVSAKKGLNLEDIKKLVDRFYGKVRQDDLLADIFNKVIGNHWPTHLEKMYRFWQTVLLEEHTYNGSPFAPHIKLPVQAEHFERWKLLFFETVDENFTGDKAGEAKFRATKMAEMFQLKIEYFQNKK